MINNKLEKLFVDGKLSDLDLFMNQKNSLLSIAVDPLEVKTASKLSFKLPSPRNNLICEIVHPSLIEVTQVDPPVLKRSDSDESGELRDVVGEGGMRWNRLLSTRSSGRLHSVEDLTTDSTCVYKARRHLTR